MTGFARECGGGKDNMSKLHVSDWLGLDARRANLASRLETITAGSVCILRCAKLRGLEQQLPGVVNPKLLQKCAGRGTNPAAP
jgi:hypothetical protein